MSASCEMHTAFGTIPSIGLKDLPLELKEQIYEYCLTDVSPSRYVLYRHAKASNWSFRHLEGGNPPSVLLVCQSIRREILSVLFRVTNGPTLYIEPKRTGNWQTSKTCLFDKADETQSVFELEHLLATTRKIRLVVGFPVSVTRQGYVLGLLRYLVACLNARAASLSTIEHVTVEVLPEASSEPLRPKANDSVCQILNGIQCQDVSVAFFQLWFHNGARKQEEVQKVEQLYACKLKDYSDMREAFDLTAARENLLASCDVKRCTSEDVGRPPATAFQTWPVWPSCPLFVHKHLLWILQKLAVDRP